MSTNCGRHLLLLQLVFVSKSLKTSSRRWGPIQRGLDKVPLGTYKVGYGLTDGQAQGLRARILTPVGGYAARFRWAKYKPVPAHGRTTQVMENSPDSGVTVARQRSGVRSGQRPRAQVHPVPKKRTSLQRSPSKG